MLIPIFDLDAVATAMIPSATVNFLDWDGDSQIDDVIVSDAGVGATG